MSLHAQPLKAIPDLTSRIAHASFPKGTLAMHQRDALGQIYEDAESISRCAGTNGGLTRLVVPLVVLSDP